MQQYLDLLQNILQNGVEKESGRDNMPNTIGISNGTIKMDLSKGFPLLTTKKMYWKGIVHELLWFLKGDTNVKYLVDNKVNIWTEHAYGWYEKYAKLNNETNILTEEEFNTALLELPQGNVTEWYPGYYLGDLGKVYGYQWRNQNGVDQVRDVIEGLKNNPYSRYHIIDAWNKADFKKMALPPCHLLYQFIVRPLSVTERRELYAKKCEYPVDVLSEFNHDFYNEHNVPKFYLDLNMYQRSCDSACGLPFNLASMSLLLKIFSDVSNMIPGIATWIGGDTHIYVNHIETVKEQIKKIPYELPTVNILKDIKTLDDILALNVNDFELCNYQSHEKLFYELFVGLKANPKKV